MLTLITVLPCWVILSFTRHLELNLSTTLMPLVLLDMQHLVVLLMLLHSFLPKLLLTCTVGVKTLLSPLSFNLTVKTDSLNVKVLTSMSSNLSNTTPRALPLASTYTPSPLDLKNTNHLEHATSPESITPFFNLSFLPELYPVLPLLR